MKIVNLLLVVIFVISFSGCFRAVNCLFNFKSNRVMTLSGSPFYDTSFFLDKSNPRSKRLGGSTEDYGYGRENQDAYIMKFYSTYYCDEEIPTSNMYFMGGLTSAEQNLPQNANYEKRHLYSKQPDGSYVISYENFNNRKIPIKECYDDGYCKTYKDWDGKTHYIKKKFLEPYNLEKDLKMINER